MDDVAGAPDHDRVADAHVLARDLVHVVQRCIAHGHAADEHRPEPRDRRDRAGASDLELDRGDGRLDLVRRELVRERPPWRPRGKPEPFLPVTPVDLVHDAVDLVRELRARVADALVEGEAAVHARDHRRLRAGAQPEVAQGSEQLAVAAPLRERGIGDGPDAIAEEGERPRRRDARIELAHGAGRGVAGIDEGLLAARRECRVHALEALDRHEHLAADLEQGGRGAAQVQRHATDGADVRGHVLASRPVTARRGLREHTLLVGDRNGEPVEFRLGRVIDGAIDFAEPLARPPVECARIVRREAVVERQHRHAMDDFAECIEGRRTDPLRR